MTYHSNLYEEDKFIDICNLTTSLVGLKKGSLAYKSRKQELHVLRSIAAVIGRLGDIHPTIIAKVLKRSRYSVYHYEKVHEGHYASWGEYRDKFNLILTAYNDLREMMPQFTDCLGMKKHILNFVRESRKEQVEILLTSGEAGCKIVTSFQDFSHTLENIKIALKNYSHSIKINLL